MRHTKIIATIGPASRSPAVIAALIDAGVDVFRLNFSHGTHEEHGAVLETIRRWRASASGRWRSCRICRGPRFAPASWKAAQPSQLTPGAPLELRIGAGSARPGMVSTTYAPLAAAVKPGDRLLLDDGKIELVVEHARRRRF